MTTSIIAAAMMRDVSRDARRRVGRERGGDERFSRPDPVALSPLASLNPKNRGRAETATARASRRARATPLSVIHVFGVRTFPKKPGWYLSIMILWWCWPPALPRPEGCLRCLPMRPCPADT